ncbi:hypothetical protein [Curtobacterium sp. ISL-83]|uniref:hypothetical protein n=1 Tax=Curtobacterium sp. ISL-83 TaxID=2819145 RepID=UPI001BED2074|nr:hypothetical protein [Curtobacterium sp. ISL-83]MBT2503009.1 hypothetical protein [Curtobacterium sp. ISL-83]
MTAVTAVRIEFAPALFTRELAAFYISGSLRDIDDLRAKGELIPVGDTKRVKFRKEDLDRYVANLSERD